MKNQKSLNFKLPALGPFYVKHHNIMHVSERDNTKE
jgi:hypothetical protein